MAGDRTPVWPDGVVGSITHTGDFAAAAVAWAADIAGLGIDSEQVIDPAAARDIADIWRPMAAAFANSAHWCFQQRRLSSSAFSAHAEIPRVLRCANYIVRLGSSPRRRVG
jgi:4'-phosphopantetheinyl transferase EntD